MISGRLDFWGALQDYVRRAEKDWCKVTTEQELTAFEKKWLDQQRGIVARLETEPFLAQAQPNARRVFVDYLSEEIRGLVVLWRKTEGIFGKL